MFHGCPCSGRRFEAAAPPAEPPRRVFRSFRLYEDGSLYAEAEPWAFEEALAPTAQSTEGSQRIQSNSSNNSSSNSSGNRRLLSMDRYTRSRRAVLQYDARYPVSSASYWPNNAIAHMVFTTNQDTGAAEACTGTWVTGYDVLTAAHCLTNWTLGNQPNSYNEWSRYNVSAKWYMLQIKSSM